MGIKNKCKITFKRLTRCLVRWWKHEHANTAASLAFYSLISLVPILITGVWVASLIVGERIARESLLEGTQSIAGKNVSDYFSQLLNKDISWFGSGISPIFGGVFLLYAATKVIAKLRNSLGGIFGSPRPKGKRAMLANAMSQGIGIILLLFLGGFIACAVVVETILMLVVNSVGESSILFKLMTYSAPLLTFMAVVFLSATAMKWLPQRPPAFKNALQGGIVSAILLAALKFGLTAFLKYADVGSYYGSSLALVLVLCWIYFAMQAFLFGAEYAAELSREQRQQDYVEDRLTDDHVDPHEHMELEELAIKGMTAVSASTPHSENTDKDDSATNPANGTNSETTPTMDEVNSHEEIEVVSNQSEDTQLKDVTPNNK